MKCPMTKEEYDQFVRRLSAAIKGNLLYAAGAVNKHSYKWGVLTRNGDHCIYGCDSNGAWYAASESPAIQELFPRH